MGKNKIENIKENSFENLNNLNELAIDSNNLKSISKKFFIGLIRLHKLDISHNEILSIEKNSLNYLINLKMLKFTSFFVNLSNGLIKEMLKNELNSEFSEMNHTKFSRRLNILFPCKAPIMINTNELYDEETGFITSN